MAAREAMAIGTVARLDPIKATAATILPRLEQEPRRPPLLGQAALRRQLTTANMLSTTPMQALVPTAKTLTQRMVAMLGRAPIILVIIVM